MNAQQTKPFAQPPADMPTVLAAGNALSLGEGGCLEVLAGRVWLTRAGELDDVVVESGECLSVGAASKAVIEALDRDERALVAWRPRTLAERLHAGVQATFARCWELMSPLGRLGLGSLAAVAALATGGGVFGPLSDARSQALAAPAVLHNGSGTGSSAGAAAAHDDHAILTAERARERARVGAQEAHRRTAGAA